jgi:hypothetical protein
MFEPSDNIPTDWPRGGRSFLRERLALWHWRRLMVDFAKFVKVHSLDALEPDELLDAWLEQTYHKPEKESAPAAGKYAYRERPRSTGTETGKEFEETALNEVPMLPTF